MNTQNIDDNNDNNKNQSSRYELTSITIIG